MLKNKIIVITGGSGLLGKEITTQAASKGATVISLDINMGNTIATDEYKVDVGNEEELNEVIKSIVKKYGRIDGWVNNAYPRTNDWGNKLEDVSIQSWRTNVDLQMNGYFLCCKLVLEQMKEFKKGAIINMASIYGVVAPDFSIYEGTEMTMPVAYSAIKGGIINLTRYLAAYYGPNNLRVNCISPGGVFNNQANEFVKKYESKTPLGRMATPADIAPSVCFLLSDGASYITGHNLIIDGGWTIK